MPETFNDKPVFSLFELTQSVKETITARYIHHFWIKAELNKLNYYQHSGHCYPELVEKRDDKVIAQMRSNLWSDDFRRINASFLRVLNEPLKDGIKILFLAKLEFHSTFGLSLRILDIDPGYTMGDLEREKLETLNRLKAEGVYALNKSLKFPMLPQRMAIISVESSKGYADFIKVIEQAHSTWGYAFFHLLFPSLLQGDKAVPSIIIQLNKIRKVVQHFDVVAIIRGGGGDIGLSCYNHYDLAKAIAQFPIPVITGIGHATNQTVAEMIAFENAITPTKLAEFIIQQFHQFSVPVQKAEEKILDRSRRLLTDEHTRFTALTKLFMAVAGRGLFESKSILDKNIQVLLMQATFMFRTATEEVSGIRQRLLRNAGTFHQAERQSLQVLIQEIHSRAESIVDVAMENLQQQLALVHRNTKQYIKEERITLNGIEKNLVNMSPDAVLRRGYSITRLNGKAITRPEMVKTGDVIHSTLHQGEVISTVHSTSKSPKQ